MPKSLFNLIKSKFFWGNLLICIIVLASIGVVCLQVLKRTTNHGEAIEVPDVIGMYEHEAQEAFRAKGLKYEIIDSVYLRDRKPGEIVEQTPKSSASVKEGRIIYLTINTTSEKMVVVPNLINTSVRQAKYTLTSLGFNLTEEQRVPSEFPDLVLEVLSNGRNIGPGDKLKDGATITLIVGESAGEEGQTTITPAFYGLSLGDAEAKIRSNYLVIGSVEYDIPPSSSQDRAAYIVYRQSPEMGESVTLGKRVDLWLSKDPKKVRKPENSSSDEFFF